MSGVFGMVFWGILVLYGLFMIGLALVTESVGLLGGLAGLVLVVSGGFWIVQGIIKRGP